LVVMPGEGFMPIPDLVFQFRTTKPDEFVEQVRKSITGINRRHVEREQREPWREAEVKDRAVFWRQGASSGGMMMPFVMRPVLFTTRESDAEGVERHCIVLGMTSADPERLVKRWTELPRNKECRHLPTSTKTNGQGWINWPVVYDTFSPYVNLSLSAVVRDAVLPELGGDHMLGQSLVDVKVAYTGLEAGHVGPVPLGAVIVPALGAAALARDRSGGSDLARERLACERLRVFYHHAKLFQKDHDRWPAELTELDGYVDFAGHPELLQLDLSPQKEWANVFQGMFGAEETDDEDGPDKDEEADVADDAAAVEIDDKLFEVQWAPTTWQLGLAPETLDHLKSLTIDQDGKIHRVAKEATDAPAEAVTTTP
ncbi:MAG: hypothetical protein HOP29_17515, partial [Phycisphaerales bacterium]|nr:hypothetical protein [Phycisphaerales bacterium]